jgi:hypothetical protein
LKKAGTITQDNEHHVFALNTHTMHPARNVHAFTLALILWTINNASLSRKLKKKNEGEEKKREKKLKRE